MKEALFLDLKNNKQMEWFNKKGRKMVKWIDVDAIQNTSTGEIVGRIIAPQGLLGKIAVKKGKSFLGKTTEYVMTRKS